jgi:hypothetical protein
MTRAHLAVLSLSLATLSTALGAQGAPSTKPDSTHQPPPKPAAPPLDFSAWVFGNFQLQTDSAAKAANGGSSPNKFDIGRAYLTFRGPVGNRASFRVTTDIKQGGTTADYKGWFVRLKYGYLQYDYLKPTAHGVSGYARVGMLHTVVIDHQETFWPRYLDRTAVERNGFFSSADLGFAAQLGLPSGLGEVYGTIVNGTGYENPESNRYKDFALRLSLAPFARSTSLLKTFTVSPWFSLGGNASPFLNDPTDPVTERLAKNRWGVFLGNRDRRLTFGAEYAERRDEADVGSSAATSSIASTTGRLYDGFVIVRPTDFVNPDASSSLGAVFRWDHFTPDTGTDGYTQFVLAGIFWEPTRKTSLALDYQRAEPKNGLSGSATETWFLHWNLVF